MELPQTEKDLDNKYKWKILVPVSKGWPAGMSKAFKVKAQFDTWLTENDISGLSFYNMLYLTRDKDVVYFKLSWPGAQNFQVIKLR
tara:strand:- start:1301 stop:1558 length:258 start_codon:yes stop_codon:yes gene_type:complete